VKRHAKVVIGLHQATLVFLGYSSVAFTGEGEWSGQIYARRMSVTALLTWRTFSSGLDGDIQRLLAGCPLRGVKYYCDAGTTRATYSRAYNAVEAKAGTLLRVVPAARSPWQF
jgi:hypothetical protein